MKGTRNRTPSELKAYKQSKLDAKEAQQNKTYQERIQKIKRKEFRSNHLVIEKYLTYSNKRVFLNKKAFLRLIEEGMSKWSLR